MFRLLITWSCGELRWLNQYSDWPWAWWLGFDSWQICKFFCFITISRLAVVAIRVPVCCILGAIFLGVKQTGHYTNHLHISNAKVMNVWSCTSIPLYFLMTWSLSSSIQLHRLTLDLAQGQLYVSYFSFLPCLLWAWLRTVLDTSST